MFHVEQLADQLRGSAAALDIPLEEASALGMAKHLLMLEQWNAQLNLVGPGNPASWLSRHSLDSLVALAAIPSRSRVLDVGSGAGFPGIPLAIARPDAQFALSERRAKRRAFLQNVLAATGVSNATVMTSASGDELYDVVLGRAVLPAKEWVAYAASLVRPGGRVGHFAQEDADEPLAAADAAGLHRVGARAYTLPGEATRRRFSWYERAVPRET